MPMLNQRNHLKICDTICFQPDDILEKAKIIASMVAIGEIVYIVI